jgi:hypothetical protein
VELLLTMEKARCRSPAKKSERARIWAPIWRIIRRLKVRRSPQGKAVTVNQNTFISEAEG